MKIKRKSRDTYLLLAAGLVTLALLWGGVVAAAHKHQMALQHELRIAIDKGDSAGAQELLARGVNPQEMEDPVQLLIAAVVYCDPATVETLIKKGINVNDKNDGGITPLHYAVTHRRSDIVEVLLKNGADVRIKKPDGDSTLAAMAKTAHRFARHDNDKKILRLLQEAEKSSKSPPR